MGLRGEATGFATLFRADVAAIAKRDLSAGEALDGEGGYTVSGGLRPASISVKNNYLPLGLAHNVVLKNAVSEGQSPTWYDVDIDTTTAAYRLRQEIESKVDS